MRQLLPTPAEAVDPDELYAADERPPWPDRPWVLANMIASLDGATHVDGLSGGLGSDADRRAFRAIRAVADVILVAAGTARSEQYRPIALDAGAVAARRARGQRDLPRLAILTRRLDLDLDGPLFAAAEPPVVVTTEQAPAGRLRHAEQLTTVMRFPGDKVPVESAVGALGRSGAGVVLTEGGPTLVGQLAAADVLDELCLSISPLLAGGDASRVTDASTPPLDRPFRLARLLEEDDMLLARYVRRG